MYSRGTIYCQYNYYLVKYYALFFITLILVKLYNFTPLCSLCNSTKAFTQDGDTMRNDRIKVMLTTEGTYPFHQGGVSTWCNFLVEKLTEVDFTIYSIIMNPFVTQKFILPSNAGMIKVPLWGTEEPSEHLTTPFSKVYTAKRYTDKKIVESHFIPLFQNLIEEIINFKKNPLKLGGVLSEMYKYFQEYDYKNSFKSEAAWEVFKGIILNYTNDGRNKLAQPSVFDLIQSLGWIYRFLIILNTPLPRVDVTHSAAAAFCGIPSVLAKLENRTPFLLTEHGVYLREQYLSLSRRGYSSYLNTFLIRMIHSVSSLNYALADQVSPVCVYNTRWEKMFGVHPGKIDVIFNGVDQELFSMRQNIQKNPHPTVVAVARIDPVKDLITLIRAAVIVKDRIPDVRFIVYGSVSVPEYYEECLALRKELALEETFIFAGHTDDAPAAYRTGDVVALSSITEAFPYSVIEAMMTEKPVVATDVGGVKEAVGGCGIIVRPRSPEQFAQALITLLEDPEMREALGKEARERALNYFTIERALELYLNSYQKLAFGVAEPKVIPLNLKRQKLLSEKGYALAEIGHWREAISQFRLAIDAAVDSTAVPVLLTEIARAYNNLGNFDMAFNELEKVEAMVEYLENNRIA
ncbi:MAG: D-inositol 3-phosphate glycosyltransferase [Pelotomaculum sp. PtaU1.Bin035]|nr:MAG: D-inositol 3-phosphate glycosyltransferase [Pelotomaculum sp. PtaU1.Bin035]